MELERLDRDALLASQGRRLSALIHGIYGRNAFYTRKLDEAGIAIAALQFPRDLTMLPFTLKRELIADQDANPPWGTALTEPIERYTRYCQTSSTTGHPLRWVDTNESWQWMLDCWKAVYRGGAGRPGRPGVLPVLVRPVPRLLGRLRGRLPDEPALHPRRRACRPRSGWR